MTANLYLYGILPASETLATDLEGLDQQPVHTQTIGDFAFLYSKAQQKCYLASRRNLLGHERVLEQAMQAHQALLPLQFGMTIDNWAVVEQQLVLPMGEKLKQLFSKLIGRREVGIKVFWEREQELATLMQEDADLRASRDQLAGKPLSMEQVVQIGQAIERAMQSRQQQIIQTFQAVLNPLALEIVENDTLTDAMIYNAAYLIDWETEPQFGQLVESLDQQFEGQLRIRYNNFTAPFNFARLAD